MITLHPPRAVRALVAFILLWLGSPQTATALDETLEQNYMEKLKKPFVSAISWESNLEKAKQQSAEKNLPIIAYFTRSYAP